MKKFISAIALTLVLSTTALASQSTGSGNKGNSAGGIGSIMCIFTGSCGASTDSQSTGTGNG